MARVVQRRKNPLLPVLIAFVFLFVIAATLAVIFYNEKDEAIQQTAKKESLLRKLASPTDLKLGSIQTILRDHGKTRQTMVAAYMKQIQTLTKLVMGFETPTQNVVKHVNDLRDEIKSSQSLIDEIRQIYKLRDAQVVQEEKLRGELTTAREEYTTLEASKKVLAEKYGKDVSALNQEKLDLEGQLDAAKKERLEKLAATDKEWQVKLDEQKKKVDELVERLGKAALESQKKDIKIAGLQAIIDEWRRTRPIDLAVRPAGKIKEVVPNQPVCFVPLGSDDRVVRGMTFRVYDPTGIPKDGSGYKAAITVTRVFNHLSQCRITPARKRDMESAYGITGKKPKAVAKGDLFANIAYNPTHVPTFVVEGNFDLFGTGRATDTGKQEVINLIRRAGGRVGDKLDIKTDFLVLGVRPVSPSKPAEDADETEQEAYKIALKTFQHYQKVADIAAGMNIPVLNATRFLALTGYDPQREIE